MPCNIRFYDVVLQNMKEELFYKAVAYIRKHAPQVLANIVYQYAKGSVVVSATSTKAAEAAKSKIRSVYMALAAQRTYELRYQTTLRETAEGTQLYVNIPEV